MNPEHIKHFGQCQSEKSSIKHQLLLTTHRLALKNPYFYHFFFKAFGFIHNINSTKFVEAASELFFETKILTVQKSI